MSRFATAHVAIRRVHLGGQAWLYAHGWVLGSSTGAGLATNRAEAIRNACIEAASAGAKVVCLPSPRDWSAAPAPIKVSGSNLPGPDLSTHEDPAAVAVAQRDASVELMREFVRRRGVPDLLGEAAGVIDTLGGPETVADVIGCDAAQVCRWARAGRLPDVRIKALKRELAALA